MPEGRMPQRPRQHELEDESRTAFASALPSSWVFHENRQDYGLDGEVEIFDAGEATGLLYKVQLKATDEEDISNALAVRLRRSHANYYRELGLPVLIARYHAPSDRLFVKWFHSYDPYYGGQDSETFTFRFSEADEWNEGTPELLRAGLEAFRRWRSPRISLPIPFALDINVDDERRTDDLELAIYEAADRGRSFVALEQDASGSISEIRISDDLLVVDLKGGFGATLHHMEDVPDWGRVPNDVFVGIAMAFDIAGQTDIAARLLSTFAAESNAIVIRDVLVWATSCLARAHRLIEALQVARDLQQRADFDAVFAGRLVEVIPYLIEHSDLSPGEVEAYRKLLHEHIRRAEAEGDAIQASITNYNLALAYDRDWSRVFFHYCEAVRWDPDYFSRDYYCERLGGMFFETGHFDWSVEFYARAMRLGAEGIVPFLYADALLFAGRFAEAEAAFEDADVLEDPDAPGEMRLKAITLPVIREATGVDVQNRDVETANDIALRGHAEVEDDARERICDEAFTYDALCPLAWFTLGVVATHRGLHEEAFECFLASATMGPGSPDAWSNVLGVSFVVEAPMWMVTDILVTARRRLGHAFYREIRTMAQRQADGFPTEEFIRATDALMREIEDKPSRGFTLRFPHGEQYETLDVSLDSAGDAIEESVDREDAMDDD